MHRLGALEVGECEDAQQIFVLGNCYHRWRNLGSRHVDIKYRQPVDTVNADIGAMTRKRPNGQWEG